MAAVRLPAGRHDAASPLALVASAARGIVVTAVNEAAFAAGVRPGQALADARAVLPVLASRAAEPGRDRAALLALAGWLGRYGPARHIDDEDGLWVDTTGVAHLYGGEPAMLADLHRRLSGMGFTPRIALAGTCGAAHALARAATGRRQPWLLVGEGTDEISRALAGLPVEALRLDGDAVQLARRLGLKRIGQLYGLPRASLARRFRSEAVAAALVERLDAALGHRPEPRASLAEPPELSVAQRFAEPLISSEGLVAAITALAGRLCQRLGGFARGLRRVRLTLYRADGTVAEIVAGTAAPVREAAHVMGLLGGRLESIDAGFGIDVVTLEALASEPLHPSQVTLAASAVPAGEEGGGAGSLALRLVEGHDADVGAATARLIDRLAVRLGAGEVQCLASRPSHRPERASARRPWLAVGVALSARESAGGAAEAFAAHHHVAARPPLLLDRPEPITVMAEVPDGPPLRFTWRRVEHRVTRAEGPERIEPEWWRALPGQRAPATAGEDEAAAALGARVPPPAPNRPRDYYRIEDHAGGRYWVFRDGLYGRAGEEGAPVWFLHGLFG